MDENRALEATMGGKPAVELRFRSIRSDGVLGELLARARLVLGSSEHERAAVRVIQHHVGGGVAGGRLAEGAHVVQAAEGQEGDFGGGGGVDGGIEELRVGRVLFESLAGALKFFALAIDSGIRCGIHHRGVDVFFAGVEKKIGLAQQRPAIGGAEEVHGGEHRDKGNAEESAKNFQYSFHSFFILFDLLCAARSRATVQQGQWQEA